MFTREQTIEANRQKRIQHQRDFLKAYRRTGHIGKSCEYAEIHRQTFNAWKKFPKFRKKFEAIRESMIDDLEVAAYNRAVTNSDQVLIFLLKSLRHSEYMEKQQFTHVHTTKFDEEVQKLVDQLSADAPTHGESSISG